MQPFSTKTFGNPASRHHAFGWAARDAVEKARKQVSRLVGCNPREAHIVTAETEHRAVLDPCHRPSVPAVPWHHSSADRID